MVFAFRFLLPAGWVVDFIMDFIFGVLFYRVGLRVLRALTFGKFPENNSYLRFVPVLVGLFAFVCFAVFLLLVITELRGLM